MQSLGNRWPRCVLLIAISMCAALQSCRHIGVVDEEKENFDLWVRVLADKIDVSIVNVSSADMLLEVGNMGIGYLLSYKSAITCWATYDDNFYVPANVTPLGSLHVLQARGFEKRNTVHPLSLFSFTIEKPVEFEEIQCLEIVFRAIPLANAFTVKDVHTLNNALHKYRLTYEILNHRERHVN